MVSDAVDLEKVAIRRDDGSKDLTVAPSADGNQEDDDEEEEEEEDDDNSSTTSSTLPYEQCDDNARDDGGGDGAMVLADPGQDRSPCFQNIEVTNSRDVHFGNKTYYQGPVTIKQILYTNPNSDSLNSDERDNNNKLPIAGTDNDGYVTDSSPAGVANAANGSVKNGSVSVHINSHNNNSNWTSKSKGKKWLQNLTGRQLLIATVILTCLVASIVGVTVILLIRYIPDQESISNPNSSSGSVEEDLDVPNNYPEANVRIINRRKWVAEPADKTVPLRTPVSKVLIVETSTASCTNQSDCIFIVRHLQSNHKEGNSLWDIRYNFLVGGDGNAYEGRGWTQLSATLPTCSDNSIGIALIGTFKYVAPPENQVNTVQRLINLGVKKGYISTDYKVVYASQIIGDGSYGYRSGKKLNEIISKWSHWLDVNYTLNDTLKQRFCNS
ncbi:putative animal peptidoglycan recognition proteins homologous to Bacteriophage T3 lysozyme [Trypoxylus dichotomus]